MKESAASPRKNPASLFITIGVVLVHIIVIGLVIWGCNSGSKAKKGTTEEKSGTSAKTEEVADSSGETPETPADAPASEPAPNKGKKDNPPPKNTKATRWCDQDGKKGTAPRRLRVPSGKPNFGRPLTGNDLKKADHSSQEKFLPGLKKWDGTGIIVDMDTREVLWEKNADKAVPIASMTKMMTILLVVEEIDRNPNLSLDTKITVTESAMKAVPEKMKNQFKNLKPGDVYTVRQLLLCTAVISNNDAATQLAEVVGGSVDAFVGRMNKRARELGLRSAEFYTPSGLTDKRGRISRASAADMVILAEHLLEYPEVFKMFSAPTATVNGQTYGGTNNTISGKRGIDGVKTGYIEKAKLCLTFSVLRKNHRVIGCVTRFLSKQDRNNFCYNLIDWAYGAPAPTVKSTAPRKKSSATTGKKSGKSNKSGGTKKKK